MSVCKYGLIILSCMTLGCLPSKLDRVWGQLEEKVEARQKGHLTDEEFVKWNMDYLLNVLPTRKERRFSPVGYPPIIVDFEKSVLSPCARNGQWLNLIAASWGETKGEEAYAYWSDSAINDLLAASRKECILLAPLFEVWPEDGTPRTDDEIIIYDIAIRIRPLYWIFVYGEDVLLYPDTPKLEDLRIPYYMSKEYF